MMKFELKFELLLKGNKDVVLYNSLSDSDRTMVVAKIGDMATLPSTQVLLILEHYYHIRLKLPTASVSANFVSRRGSVLFIFKDRRYTPWLKDANTFPTESEKLTPGAIIEQMMMIVDMLDHSQYKLEFDGILSILHDMGLSKLMLLGPQNFRIFTDKHRAVISKHIPYILQDNYDTMLLWPYMKNVLNGEWNFIDYVLNTPGTPQFIHRMRNQLPFVPKIALPVGVLEHESQGTAIVEYVNRLHPTLIDDWLKYFEYKDCRGVLLTAAFEDINPNDLNESGRVIIDMLISQTNGELCGEEIIKPLFDKNPELFFALPLSTKIGLELI